ncbi:MAG: cell division protein SepF [Candidatus Syntropharchaeales archaeon]|nr:cell division protein SepF [Candidatus Syntrophoarchaeum sp.]
MPKGFLDKLLNPQARLEEEEYIDLDLAEYEDILDEEPAALYVKIAEFTGVNDLPEIKKEIYNGNIVITDVALIKNDKIVMDRVVKELKQVVADIRGDIAMAEHDLIIVTPANVKVDRKKLVRKY